MGMYFVLRSKRSDRYTFTTLLKASRRIEAEKIILLLVNYEKSLSNVMASQH